MLFPCILIALSGVVVFGGIYVCSVYQGGCGFYLDGGVLPWCIFRRAVLFRLLGMFHVGGFRFKILVWRVPLFSFSLGR